MEQKPLALEAFKRACQLGPELAEAHNNLGALLNEASDYEGALKELQTAARIEPDRAAIWLNLGNANRGAKKYDDAEAAYRKALELGPKNADPLFNLAILYLDGDFKGKAPLDRLTQALGYFDQFKRAGGADTRLARYQQEAEKSVKKEKDRLVREERDKLKKAEAQRKIDDELKRRENGKLGHLEEDEGPTPAPQKAVPSGKIGKEEEEK